MKIANKSSSLSLKKEETCSIAEELSSQPTTESQSLEYDRYLLPAQRDCL